METDISMDINDPKVEHMAFDEILTLLKTNGPEVVNDIDPSILCTHQWTQQQCEEYTEALKDVLSARAREKEELLKQIDVFNDIYLLFDKEGMGTIKSTELGDVMRALDQTPTDEELEEMIIDPEGTIEFPDFMKLLTKYLQAQDNEEEIKGAFKVFDKDNDGTVLASELKVVTTKLGTMLPEDEVDREIQIAGVDEKGQINYIEYIKQMM